MQNQAPGRLLGKEFYSYALSFSALANATDATGVINIEADSWFIAQKLTFAADIAAAAQTDANRVIPLVTVLITDTGSGRQLSNQAIPIPATMGTGELPFILPTPKIFKPRSALSIKVANYSAATTYNLYLVLHGAKAWYE